MSVAAMHQLLATSFAVFLSFQLSHASVLLDGRSTGGLGSVNIHDTPELSFLEPRPGYKAFVGLQPPPVLHLGRRDCLSNGSNFCFGNNVNFCADCGTCCVEGRYCCGKGGICCGTGCCTSGQTCSPDGKCQPSGNVVTVISTMYETSTHTEHQEATVVIVEVATSTILSTVETTISNAATQTDVHWVTATVTEAPAPKLLKRRDVSDGNTSSSQPKKSFLNSLIPRGLDFLHNGVPLHRRQAVTVGPPAPTAAASTVTKFATQVSTITEHDVKSFTETSTSYVMTTIIETVTKVLNAQTTVLVTSTLTITSHQPTTRFIITTADPVRPATGSSTPSAPPTAGGTNTLTTPAIAGIAAGSAAAALLLLLLAIFLIRRRRRRRSPTPGMKNFPPPGPENMQSRQPTLPNLVQFAPSAPSHHAAPANLPNGYVSPSSNASSPGSHQRSSSGFSTLIGTPLLPGGGNSNVANLKAGDRRSGFSMGSGTTLEHNNHPVQTSSPVEVPGSQVQEWYEADGKPLVVVSTEPVIGRDAAGSPPLPPLPPSPTRPGFQRQGPSYYYHYPSPGQRIDQAQAAGAATALPEELDGNDNPYGRTSPVGLTSTASQTTTVGGSGSSSPGGNNYVGVGGREAQQDGHYYQTQEQQQQQHQQHQHFQVHAQDYAPQSQSPQERGYRNENGGYYNGGAQQQQQHQGQGQGQEQGQLNYQQSYYYPGS